MARKAAGRTEALSESRSAARALGILEQFGRLRRPLRAIELVNAMGMAPSSMAQLLRTLTHAGYLLFDYREKLYYPSPRLFDFIAWMSAEGSGLAAVRLTSAVYDAIGENVSLSFQNDCYIQGVRSLLTSRLTDDFVERPRTPVFGSVSGLALLATCTDGEIRALGHRARFLAANRIDTETIIADARGVRERGFASGYSPHYRELSGGLVENGEWWALAMALPRTIAGGMPLVLWVGGPTERVRPREAEIAGAMRRALNDALARGDSVA